MLNTGLVLYLEHGSVHCSLLNQLPWKRLEGLGGDNDNAWFAIANLGVRVLLIRCCKAAQGCDRERDLLFRIRRRALGQTKRVGPQVERVAHKPNQKTSSKSGWTRALGCALERGARLAVSREVSSTLTVL
jgi:hypothetical protein